LAKKIEDAVAARVAHVDLSKYVKAYAKGEDGRVYALYGKVCTDGQSSCPQATIEWTTEDQLRPSCDGGCGTIRVVYDPEDGKLISADCNGEA